jgi:hypothetical protein
MMEREFGKLKAMIDGLQVIWQVQRGGREVRV